MNYSESAGIIPLLFSDGEWRVFLIQNQSHPEYWSCPKGQIESGETQIAAALRELKEETHLDLEKLIHSEPIVEEFVFKKSGIEIHKRIYFFLAVVTGSVVLDSTEASDGKWLSISQAIQITKHTAGKATLSKAASILSTYL